MAGYFDNSDGTIKIIEYTWADINTNGETWADLPSWQSGSDAYGFSPIDDVADIEFFTAVLDLGRKDWVNPLCSVDAAGDVNVKVFASETATSDTIPGDPVINGQTGQTFDAVYGRYFQFKVEVFSNSAEEAQLNNVQTNLSTSKQTEFFSEDSTNHNGTTDMRYPTLVNEYSKVLLVNGAARLVDTDDSTPLLVTGIADRSDNAISITNSGGVDAVEDVYKFEPAALRFNDNTGSALTDTDDNLQFSLTDTGITTGEFTIDFWYQPVKMTWLDSISSPPNYAHSPYFFYLNTAGTDLYLRTKSANTHLGLDYSFDGSTWYAYAQEFTFGSGPSNDWYHIKVSRGSNNYLKLKLHNLTTHNIDTNYTETFSGTTMNIGDLGGNATVGNFYIDDFRISSTDRIGDGIPGAEPIITTDTQFLLTGQQSNVPVGQTNVPIVTVGALTDKTQARYAIYRSSGAAVDAFVSLQVTGLPKLSSDDAGNLVQET